MWTLTDKISGVIYNNKFRYRILEIGHELIEDYKKEDLKVMLKYIGNCTYILTSY